MTEFTVTHSYKISERKTDKHVSATGALDKNHVLLTLKQTNIYLLLVLWM